LSFEFKTENILTRIARVYTVVFLAREIKILISQAGQFAFGEGFLCVDHIELEGKARSVAFQFDWGFIETDDKSVF
jgi:hypothetical protein